MLESHYHDKLELLLSRLGSGVTIPETWTDYFTREGILPTVSSDRRQFARRYIRDEAVCESSKTLPAIDRPHQFSKVHLKDISRSGVAFLITHEMYPCENLFLWTHGGKLSCSVVRCVKHNDRCFEIGAKFI
jgi:hypothetical protein